MTAGASEREKFDAFKDDWWNPEGRLKALHRINPLRFEYFQGRIADTLGGIEGRRVLDIGCGGGLLSEEFAKKGALVTGIDLSPLSIEAAREHAAASGLKIDYREAPVGVISSSGEKFDCVVCAEVLEHVDKLEDFLRDACLCLSEGGIFLFSTINKTLLARFLAIFVAEDVLGMVTPGTHDYARFIRPSVLTRMLRENSVVPREIKGMSFDPLKFGFRISGDTSVNYLGFGIKKTG